MPSCLVCARKARTWVLSSCTSSRVKAKDQLRTLGFEFGVLGPAGEQRASRILAFFDGDDAAVFLVGVQGVGAFGPTLMPFTPVASNCASFNRGRLMGKPRLAIGAGEDPTVRREATNCDREVATDSRCSERESVRRTGVAPLVRRRRASTWMYEQPGHRRTALSAASPAFYSRSGARRKFQSEAFDGTTARSVVERLKGRDACVARVAMGATHVSHGRTGMYAPGLSVAGNAQRNGHTGLARSRDCVAQCPERSRRGESTPNKAGGKDGWLSVALG